MNTVYTTDELLALLDWHREMGVTNAVDETATDWRERADTAPGKGFAYPARLVAPSPQLPTPAPAIVQRPEPAAPGVARTPAAPAPRPAPAAPVRTFPTAAPDAAALAARQSAGTARSLDELRALLAAFDGCALKATAKNLCFYRGPERARLMVIGEAPGRDEDIAGRPFVGLAGQLLDRMLAAIGESEASTHITNIVYWRPPGNRPPTPQEGQICRPFLERQIELVAPDIVLLLGGTAAKHMLNTPEGIMKVRGSWREIIVGEKRLRAMASLHPDYLLKMPAAKRQAWADLLEVKRALTT
jgi:uracil-DNA glycosylase